LHWIYLVKGFFWLILLGGTGAYLNWKVLEHATTLPSQTMPFIPYPFSILVDMAMGLIPALIGLMIFLIYLFKMMGTEIALTNKRLIYKTGLFFVQSGEVEISEVSEAKINNGILGVVLGYGSIHLDCRFVGDFNIPNISNPYKLLRQMNKMRPGHEQPATASIIPN
jgi:hypothetical protein